MPCSVLILPFEVTDSETAGAGEVLVHVAGEAVGDVPGEVGVFPDEVAEREVGVVEDVHELAHVLDALAQRGGVPLELRRGKITPFLPPPLRSKGGFKALPPKANS